MAVRWHDFSAATQPELIQIHTRTQIQTAHVQIKVQAYDSVSKNNYYFS